mmetsp:Transcript_34129/g.33308  ORF Transcript_34129/g.33308 Transcript_34129/m.33308 type:complete len:106 (+) Transcript_34129:155-472(+)
MEGSRFAEKDFQRLALANALIFYLGVILQTSNSDFDSTNDAHMLTGWAYIILYLSTILMVVLFKVKDVVRKVKGLCQRMKNEKTKTKINIVPAPTTEVILTTQYL